jgi:hypothetical protein
MSFRARARTAALCIVAAFFVLPFSVQAQTVRPEAPGAPPIAIQPGATVDAVTVETYGEVKSDEVWKYLLLRKGAHLDQAAIDRDYDNLVTLGGYRVRLVVEPGRSMNTVSLQWIVMLPWFALTAHPLYEEAPLSDPTRGVGFIVPSPPLDQKGSHVAFVTSQNRFAHHFLATLTSPIDVDPAAGREADFVVSVLSELDAYRITAPEASTIYHSLLGAEAQYLVRGTSGTQFEAGLRAERSTADSSGISAPSILPSSRGPASNIIAELGMSHACKAGPTGGWYPPYCHGQYRVGAFDAVGGLGATSEFQGITADAAEYIPVGSSTLALHAVGTRTGGVLPESRLLCVAALRAYPEPFCGTDGSLLQAEYRFRDAAIQRVKFTIFTETGSSRVRQGDQPWAPPNFQWHADSGIEIRIHGFAIDLARGSEGNRLNLGLSAQAF